MHYFPDVQITGEANLSALFYILFYPSTKLKFLKWTKNPEKLKWGILQSMKLNWIELSWKADQREKLIALFILLFLLKNEFMCIVSEDYAVYLLS